jgi:hypothetical protein
MADLPVPAGEQVGGDHIQRQIAEARTPPRFGTRSTSRLSSSGRHRARGASAIQYKEIGMAVASERLVVQLTAKEKREIRRRAREAGLNVSEFVRQAATGAAEPDSELLAILDRAERAAKESIAMIDDAPAFVSTSNVRIARMEAEAKSS